MGGAHFFLLLGQCDPFPYIESQKSSETRAGRGRADSLPRRLEQPVTCFSGWTLSRSHRVSYFRRQWHVDSLGGYWELGSLGQLEMLSHEAGLRRLSREKTHGGD